MSTHDDIDQELLNQARLVRAQLDREAPVQKRAGASSAPRSAARGGDAANAPRARARQLGNASDQRARRDANLAVRARQTASTGRATVDQSRERERQLRRREVMDAVLASPSSQNSKRGRGGRARGASGVRPVQVRNAQQRADFAARIIEARDSDDDVDISEGILALRYNDSAEAREKLFKKMAAEGEILLRQQSAESNAKAPVVNAVTTDGTPTTTTNATSTEAAPPSVSDDVVATRRRRRNRCRRTASLKHLVADCSCRCRALRLKSPTPCDASSTGARRRRAPQACRLRVSRRQARRQQRGSARVRCCARAWPRCCRVQRHLHRVLQPHRHVAVLWW
jgi:hypothetical protein